MSAWVWSLIGFSVSIVTLYLYVFISPAYKRGERFSLPLLPFMGLIILHLFVAFSVVRYVALGIDVLMLVWAIACRAMTHAGRKNSQNNLS